MGNYWPRAWSKRNAQGRKSDQVSSRAGLVWDRIVHEWEDPAPSWIAWAWLLNAICSLNLLRWPSQTPFLFVPLQLVWTTRAGSLDSALLGSPLESWVLAMEGSRDEISPWQRVKSMAFLKWGLQGMPPFVVLLSLQESCVQAGWMLLYSHGGWAPEVQKC